MSIYALCNKFRNKYPLSVFIFWILYFSTLLTTIITQFCYPRTRPQESKNIFIICSLYILINISGSHSRIVEIGKNWHDINGSIWKLSSNKSYTNTNTKQVSCLQIKIKASVFGGGWRVEKKKHNNLNRVGGFGVGRYRFFFF